MSKHELARKDRDALFILLEELKSDPDRYEERRGILLAIEKLQDIHFKMSMSGEFDNEL